MLARASALLGRARSIRTAPFFALMTAASALSLLKGFGLAAFLPPLDFGIYATFFAIGTFSASLLSFGKVERSFKRFPRLFFDGHAAQALREADDITRIVLIRSAAVAGVIATATLALGLAHLLALFMLGVGIACSASVLSNYISLQRAKSNLTQIGIAAILRTAFAIALTAIGAWAGGAEAVLGGEFVGTAITALVIRAMVKHDRSQMPTTKPREEIDPQEKELWLFFGLLIAGAPLFLDRAVVALLLGDGVLGLYALLMLFVLGSFTVTAVASQKLGPELVRMHRAELPFATILRTLLAWVGGIVAMFLASLALVYLLLQLGPLAVYTEKYGVTGQLLLATGVLGAFQTTHLCEWLLISYNREKWVFAAGSAYLASLITGVAVIALSDSNLLDFILMMAAAKAIHFLSLMLAISFLRDARPV